jgi:hypothetical protein
MILDIDAEIVDYIAVVFVCCCIVRQNVVLLDLQVIRKEGEKKTLIKVGDSNIRAKPS